MNKKLTKDEFVKRAILKHGNKYDYSKTEYIDSYTKVCIICPEHGSFWQTPASHLHGSGCPRCRRNFRLTTNDFIEKAKEVHGDKYDYSKVEYVNNKTKVCIVCHTHGEFWQIAKDHMEGRGCDKCGGTHDITLDYFKKKSLEIHGNRYNYSKVKYTGYNNKVCIICNVHGEFWQTPHSHMSGCGCPGCSESHLEKDVETYLNENKIKYEKYKHFKWLGKQHLDFYLSDYNVGIECQGVQHFKPVDYFGGDKKFTYQVKNDIKKKYLCEENNIKIIYFTDVKDESTNNMIHNINEIKEKIIEYGSNKNQCR